MGAGGKVLRCALVVVQATVRDVRQELEWAKETMKSHGRLGEAKLLSELAALQTQLRSAFVTQQALFQATWPPTLRSAVSVCRCVEAQCSAVCWSG